MHYGYDGMRERYGFACQMGGAVGTWVAALEVRDIQSTEHLDALFCMGIPRRRMGGQESRRAIARAEYADARCCRATARPFTTVLELPRGDLELLSLSPDAVEKPQSTIVDVAVAEESLVTCRPVPYLAKSFHEALDLLVHELGIVYV